MPQCRIRINWDGPGTILKVDLWDEAGKKHDVSKIFANSGGVTDRDASGLATISSILRFRRDNDHLVAEFKFQPLTRYITMAIPDNVCAQIVRLGEK